MIITFGVFRILPSPYVAYPGYLVASRLHEDSSRTALVHLTMFSLYLVICVFNLYWFEKMINGLLLRLRGMDHPDQ